MRRLADLLPQQADALARGGLGAREVAGICSDSRRVRPGFLFFALRGAKEDGLVHAPAALAAGALAVVAERALEGPQAADCIVVADARLALAQAAARFHGAQPAVVVAVTGTSGKTSVAAFVRQIWAHAGLRAAALGTTGVVTDAGLEEGALTTPDPVALHEALARLAARGIDHLAMEASSHGLDQRRLDGVRLAAGAFTNLSRDHLDYHPDMDSYFAAKMRLFEALLAPGQPAVIDVDGEWGQRAAALCAARGLKTFTVGRAGADLRLLHVEARVDATRIVVACAGGEHALALPLAGDFMVSNALVAAGLCIATGTPPARALAALESLQGAPGRLEKAGERNGAPVFVDYAHKPDALEKVLAALRPLTRGRLVVVFGCGGDRDRGKRPIMGEIAARGADIVIVTDDNPRSEDPATIRAQILAGAPGAREIADRGEAIRAAIDLLQPGDALVIAGKGHETGQIVGDVKHPFSDMEAARRALAQSA